MSNTLERSLFTSELRVSGEDGEGLIEGYAAVFNSLSVMIYDWFREEIAPGAFADSLRDDDIRALWNHNTDYPLGRTGNQTLRLAEDTHGLRIENQPPTTTWGNDALVSIRRGDVNGMSFAFRTLKDDWREDSTGQLIRRLLKVKLYEVSPATFPAYPATSVGVRASGAPDPWNKPDVPAWVRARLAGIDAESAQGRQALRRRKLTLYR